MGNHLLTGLAGNFENDKELKWLLRNEADKMGRDDTANEIGNRLLHFFADAVQDLKNERGGIVRAGTGSAMYYVWHSENLPATADGRGAGEFLPTNFSPSLFLPKAGPLSALLGFSPDALKRTSNGGPMTLELHGLYIGYDEDADRRIVAETLDASLAKGTMACLVGANGVGKSTLMRTLSGFQPALRGEVRIDGKPIGEYSPRELSEKIGVVLTERNTAAELTVEEVVGIGRIPYTNFWGTLTPADRQAVDEAIALVDIGPLRKKRIGRVSDGERQKVMIAKALAQRTDVILLDEPTAFLDYGSKVSVMRLLRQLAHEQGKAVLLSTHDLEIAFQTADEVWILQQNGLQTGTLDALEQRRAVSEFLAQSGLRYEADNRRIVIGEDKAPPLPLPSRGESATMIS